MARSVITLFQDGQQYMKTWPVKKELYSYFPECRVITATRLAISTMPPLAVVSCAMLFNTMGTDYLPQTLAIGAFFSESAFTGTTVAGSPFKSGAATGAKTLVHGDLRQTAAGRLSYRRQKISAKIQRAGVGVKICL